MVIEMLVYGTCNPEGYGDSSYEGLYLTDADIREMTPSMAGNFPFFFAIDFDLNLI